MRRLFTRKARYGVSLAAGSVEDLAAVSRYLMPRNPPKRFGLEPILDHNPSCPALTATHHGEHTVEVTCGS